MSTTANAGAVSPYPHIAPAGGDTATPLNLAKNMVKLTKEYAPILKLVERAG